MLNPNNWIFTRTDAGVVVSLFERGQLIATKVVGTADDLKREQLDIVKNSNPETRQ